MSVIFIFLAVFILLDKVYNILFYIIEVTVFLDYFYYVCDS